MQLVISPMFALVFVLGAVACLAVLKGRSFWFTYKKGPDDFSWGCK